MTFWILAALALYFVQTLLPVTFRYRGNPSSFNARDEMPEATVLVRRAERALVNVGEAMILFLPLAILAKDIEGATTGAAVFVLARCAHVLLYLAGIPYLRTVVWGVSLVGMGMIVSALV